MQYLLGTDAILDTQRYTLERAGHQVPLPRKVFAVLALLVQHPNQVITRQHLIAQIWQDEYRTDAAINVCMKQVRRVLGDSGRAQRFIQTRHGYGYQFVAPVQVREAPHPGATA